MSVCKLSFLEIVVYSGIVGWGVLLRENCLV
ncbi:hypothetical protein NSE_0736 [Neorickettsia sennetsu str. Miyayama]|uniref:Uncharacterized protein n=1 Tax=Ehrlichia sennetsu (strain ATCC VR-367 / Miyayama) TaxID=222891 RepID=Q2GD34_EHRS3|nr:hypothetical protein NSE_0736 [Neorickettsia sennetsu str. Miyayama]